jgi:hypothetical protein
MGKFHFSKIDVKSLRRAVKGDGLFRRALKAFGVQQFAGGCNGADARLRVYCVGPRRRRDDGT